MAVLAISVLSTSYWMNELSPRVRTNIRFSSDATTLMADVSTIL